MSTPPYRSPLDIEDDAWGYVLVLDPNGLRPSDPGPVYFLLDGVDMLQPGMTDRSGLFLGRINDNASDTFGRATSMMLFDYIKSNDEFWIGLQEGPGEGLENTWTPEAGGRQWVMGGWITRRFFTISGKGEVVAYIEGRDYMELWRSQPFGTPDTPRDYRESPVDVTAIIPQLIVDVNALQGNVNWMFSAHPVYFDDVLSGYTWQKQFKMEDAFSVMEAACKETNHEWRIIPYPEGATPSARRCVVYHPRTRGAFTPDDDASLQYSTNFREGILQTGDTTELITDLILTGQGTNTVPPNIGQWCARNVWMDAYIGVKEYSIFSMPLPVNAALGGSAQWGDLTQVIDDEGFPAICFQRQNNSYFVPVLAFNTDPDTGLPTSAKMQLDLRLWHRLHFKFKHGTYLVAGSVYRVRVHNSLPEGRLPEEWLNYHIYKDFTVTDNEWSADFALDLPVIDDDGNMTNMNGWVVSDGGFDPRQADFVSFVVGAVENPPPGRPLDWVWSPALSEPLLTGSFYIKIPTPENYFFRGPGFVEGYSGEIVFADPKPECQLDSEWVQIEAINGKYPDSATVKLKTATRVYHDAGTLLHIPAGSSISFSQIYFEKIPFISASLLAAMPVQLQNPKRYRFATFTDAEYLNELKSRALQDLLTLRSSMQKVEIYVDGDLRHLMGSVVTAHLDPTRVTDPVFQDVDLMVDDVAYYIDGVDLKMRLVLGTLEKKTRGFNKDANEKLSVQKMWNKELSREVLRTLERLDV